MATSTEAQKERLARLVAKYRAERARRPVQGDPNEQLDRVAEEVFGTEEGYQVLIDYLREHVDWPSPEADGQDGDLPPNGR